jgi:hypothetical protein
MKLTKILKMAIAIGLLFTISVYAHGESKPGPHGGKIKMPGAFHTEVLTYKNLGYKIFLLDINFENPTSISSFVKAKVKSKGIETPLKCNAHPDHFYCEKTNGFTDSDEELFITAERKAAKGTEVRYILPLERK